MVRLSKDSAKRKKPHSEILTIMMIDLCEYTSLSAKLKRETLDELHDIFDDLSIPCIKSQQGKILKKIGDAFLVIFKSPTDALHCAVDLQKRFREYNREHELKRDGIKIKISLHTGEVIIKKDDIYGDPVNIVSRIESLTKPGQICFSKSLFMSMNKNEIPTSFVGKARLRGLEHPIKIYRVRYPWEIRKGKRKNIFGIIKLILLLFIVLLGSYYLIKFLI